MANKKMTSGAERLEEEPMFNRRRPEGKVVFKGSFAGAARYRSPSGAIHRGRFYATETDCGKKISKGWADAKGERVTCSQCKP